MNIIEAIKSGKRHTRKSYDPPIWFHPNTDGYKYSREEILADDWIIEEKKIPITRTIALEIYRMGKLTQIGEASKDAERFEDYLKELGFE